MACVLACVHAIVCIKWRRLNCNVIAQVIDIKNEFLDIIQWKSAKKSKWVDLKDKHSKKDKKSQKMLFSLIFLMFCYRNVVKMTKKIHIKYLRSVFRT